MSKAKHMGTSPSQVSCHSKSYSCHKQGIPEQICELSTEFIDKDSILLEHRNQPGTEYIQTDARAAIPRVTVDGTLQTASEASTRKLTGKGFRLSTEDSSEHSLTDKTSNHNPGTIGQRFESGNKCEDFDRNTVCERTVLLKEREIFGAVAVPNEPTEVSTPSTSFAFQPLSVDVAKTYLPQDLLENPSDSLPEKFSYELEPMLEQKLELSSDPTNQDSAEGRHDCGVGLAENASVIFSPGLSYSVGGDYLGPAPESVGKFSTIHCDVDISMAQPPIEDISTSTNNRLKTLDADIHRRCELDQLETLSNNTCCSSASLGLRFKRPATQSKKKYLLRSRASSDRVLRSRSQQNPKQPEPGDDATTASTLREKKMKRTKKRSRKDGIADEYSRIKAHLRYLLNRMNYEKSLISAYSAEGWKGLSLEKLKPEKELQRATSEIGRLKLRVRDLFQHIDSLCAEGRLPECLFDSDGQISSEDIFCAKCGSKDLTLDNDIVLCDGVCDRGFHQFCLVPPLLKEDIPPGDEGWLCPGCDSKVDCIGLLNDAQGTNLSIKDSWEKVFPEVVAAAGNVDCNFGLPSDDSDDNDYDPQGQDIDEKSQGDESSSDASDFTSASDEFVGPSQDEQGLGLPSDDSGDNEYDPNAPDDEEEVKQESSSSDFTSDSEDLTAVLDGEVERPASIGPHGDPNGVRSEIGRVKKKGLNSELLSLLDEGPTEGGSTPVSGKRVVERLDYKMLYDETYGNNTCDSSEDEDYTDAVEPRKKRKMSGSTFSASGNGNAHPSGRGLGPADMKQDMEDTKHIHMKNHQSPKVEDKNTRLGGVQEVSSRSSSGKKVRPLSYKRLGEAATQRLYQYFKQNQYPSRATKGDLAKELGLTYVQVDKWFGNARWSFHHSPAINTSEANHNSEERLRVTNTANTSIPLATNAAGGDASSSETQIGEYSKAGTYAAAEAKKCGAGLNGINTETSKTLESRGATHKVVDRSLGLVAGLPASSWITSTKKSSS